MRAIHFSLVLGALLVCAPERGAAQDSTSTAPPAATAAPDSAAPKAEPQRPRRRSSRSAITREEIVEAGAGDAYVLVQRLRPTWLRTRGADVPRAAADVVVYQDSFRRGYSNVLEDMPTNSIQEVRYVDPIAARARYGPGHEKGVIIVVYAGTN